MIQIIIAILLSIGVKSTGGDIQILSDQTTPGGTEMVTFYDNSNSTTYTMIGTEEHGWGITGASNDGGTEEHGWGAQ
jgi:hypothetical protein